MVTAVKQTLNTDVFLGADFYSTSNFLVLEAVTKNKDTINLSFCNDGRVLVTRLHDNQWLDEITLAPPW